LLQIRSMRATDFRAILRLTDQEHWGFGTRDLWRMLRLAPKGCLVTAEHGRPIGLTTTITYGRYLGWIGNVVVQRRYRGAGVGTKLVESAVRHLRRKVKSIGLNSYPENRSMYERLNFNAIESFVRLSTSRRIGKKTGEKRSAPFSQILELDRRVTGVDRGRLLRALHGEFRRNWAWTLNGSRVSGYSLVKEYRDSSEIGPLVCEEMSLSTVTTLLQASMALAGRQPLELSVPESNQTALEAASLLGFRVERKGLVMCLADLDKVYISPAIAALGFLDKG